MSDARTAQGAARMFPGSVGGNSRVAQPFTRVKRERPPSVAPAPHSGACCLLLGTPLNFLNAEGFALSDTGHLFSLNFDNGSSFLQIVRWDWPTLANYTIVYNFGAPPGGVYPFQFGFCVLNNRIYWLEFSGGTNTWRVMDGGPEGAIAPATLYSESGGVGPLISWKAMRPNPHTNVLNFIRVSDNSPTSVSASLISLTPAGSASTDWTVTSTTLAGSTPLDEFPDVNQLAVTPDGAKWGVMTNFNAGIDAVWRSTGATPNTHYETDDSLFVYRPTVDSTVVTAFAVDRTVQYEVTAAFVESLRTCEDINGPPSSDAEDAGAAAYYADYSELGWYSDATGFDGFWRCGPSALHSTASWRSGISTVSFPPGPPTTTVRFTSDVGWTAGDNLVVVIEVDTASTVTAPGGTGWTEVATGGTGGRAFTVWTWENWTGVGTTWDFTTNRTAGGAVGGVAIALFGATVTDIAAGTTSGGQFAATITPTTGTLHDFLLIAGSLNSDNADPLTLYPNDPGSTHIRVTDQGWGLGVTDVGSTVVAYQRDLSGTGPFTSFIVNGTASTGAAAPWKQAVGILLDVLPAYIT